MDGYAVRRRRRRRRVRGRPRCTCRSSARSAPARPTLLAMSPGTAVKIMTGAPVPAGCRRGRALRVDRPRGRRRCGSPAPRRWASTSAAPARTSPRATCCSRRAPSSGRATSGLLAAVGRATVRARPRPRVVVISTGSELREPGTAAGATTRSTTATPTCSPRRPARAGAIAYRVGIVPDEPRAFRDALADQLVRADLVVTSGGVSQGRLRRGQGGAVARWAPCGSAGSRCSPASRRASASSARTRTPIFTLPGNPVSSYVSFEMFVLPALAQDDGPAALPPPDRPAPGSPTGSALAPAAGASSCAGVRYDRGAPSSPRSAGTART